ncbi:DUF2407 C-terminal domain-containing protein [Acrodontium crateriforme]|uniref:DUF2407 C-terminal domain-containing protein n=1 Tax=Acrodontium crateriforme TaxID=150365 RepID=A0AAQ3MCT0_9PEZI|nr:DUF2407 C-terminal domain-containing protein [Acrodontium crateriforme]
MMEPRPWDIVVRSAENPDIIIHVDVPASTTTLSLKQKIRAQIAAPAAESRLRLIHAGKVLLDRTALSKSINVAAPPPHTNNANKSDVAKGKQPVRDVPLAARVYVHCSIGDKLTASELAAEATCAQEADAALRSEAPLAISTAPLGDSHATTTAPVPRGFDRLLSAGFTPAEVAALRTQFLAIQAHTHTPDTMPSGSDLLALEERWLDNDSNPGTVGTEDTGGFGAEDAGGLEDMLYGNLIGFFWPIGAMGWLIREEGVWSRRRQIAVLSGFLVNLTFGFLLTLQ